MWPLGWLGEDDDDNEKFMGEKFCVAETFKVLIKIRKNIFLTHISCLNLSKHYRKISLRRI